MASILIVEDESILALTTRMDLESMGHEVIDVVDNGRDAIRIARELHPDIILMDIVLQGSISGIEATDTISGNIECKVIYMTAHADENTINAARKTRHFGFLFKPFDTYQLKKAIEDALK